MAIADDRDQVTQLVPLASFVKQLRMDLEDALREGQGHAVRFEIGDIQLELQVEVTRTSDGSIGISIPLFVPLSAEAKKVRESRSSQTLRLSLKPQTTDRQPLIIDDTTTAEPR